MALYRGEIDETIRLPILSDGGYLDSRYSAGVAVVLFAQLFRELAGRNPRLPADLHGSAIHVHGRSGRSVMSRASVLRSTMTPTISTGAGSIARVCGW